MNWKNSIKKLFQIKQSTYLLKMKNIQYKLFHWQELFWRRYTKLFSISIEEQNFNNSDYVLEWKYKGLPDENIKPPSATINFFDLSFDYYNNTIRVKFSGSCLKQNKVTLIMEK